MWCCQFVVNGDAGPEDAEADLGLVSADVEALFKQSYNLKFSNIIKK